MEGEWIPLFIQLGRSALKASVPASDPRLVGKVIDRIGVWVQSPLPVDGFTLSIGHTTLSNVPGSSVRPTGVPMLWEIQFMDGMPMFSPELFPMQPLAVIMHVQYQRRLICLQQMVLCAHAIPRPDVFPEVQQSLSPILRFHAHEDMGWMDIQCPGAPKDTLQFYHGTILPPVLHAPVQAIRYLRWFLPTMSEPGRLTVAFWMTSYHIPPRALHLTPSNLPELRWAISDSPVPPPAMATIKPNMVYPLLLTEWKQLTLCHDAGVWVHLSLPLPPTNSWSSVVLPFPWAEFVEEPEETAEVPPPSVRMNLEHTTQ